MAEVTEGTLLWEPSEQWKQQTNLMKYMHWLSEEKGLNFRDYHELRDWSVHDLEGFWQSIWDYFDIPHSGSYDHVLSYDTMPGARWFEGTSLNYAEYLFRELSLQKDVIYYASEMDALTTWTGDKLQKETAAFAEYLTAIGVQKGDRVVSYIGNIPEAIAGFLACASIGAIWSSCSPEFGRQSVIDRFQQIEPKVLLTVDGYSYGGKSFDRLETIRAIQKDLPTLEKTVLIPHLQKDIRADALADAVCWKDVTAAHATASLSFARVPFDQPLWILFSSGTTGIPKAIVQGHGGILLEHLKHETFQSDLGSEDRFFWYTTTGWMMWNIVASSLLTGASAILYDGNPTYPDKHVMWQFAEDTKMTVFGTSASFLTACMKDGIEPGRDYDLRHLKSIGSTGSPLPPEGFQWVYEHIKADLMLASISGGTDVCSAFITSSPLLPVRAGELQCRALGAAVQAFDEQGNALIDDVGELVIIEPMPSMPLYFWHDKNNERYHDSYFDVYPGVWRHGDYVKITKNGACIIYGRSDATINRGGVRMGTSEIYSAIGHVPEVVDSLVVDIHLSDGPSYMPCFVVMKEGKTLTDEIIAKIKYYIREQCSPRHVPKPIYAVDEIPYTINGKKLEVPVKKILQGTPVQQAANPGSLKNPAALTFFTELAKQT